MSSVATSTIAAVPAFKRAGWRETTVLLALAWLVPFAVHLVPWSGARPLGAYLLPVLWTTLVAVYFYGEVIGLMVGLFSPVLNLVVTGQPSGMYFWKTSLEVVAFGLLMALVVRRAPKVRLFAAPFAYVAAKTVTTALLTPEALFGSAAVFGDFFVHIFMGSLPGLVALAAINTALGWFYPKGATDSDQG
jgi:hypothetical protein